MNLSRYVGLSYEDYHCWQLVVAIYKDELGIELPDEPIQIHERHNWIEVEIEHDMDLLLFETIEGPHVGLCIGEGRMIHSDKNTGVVIERYNRAKWKNRLNSIYRHK